MSVWYRCSKCGRFPITDALKLEASEILAKAAQTPVLPCPRCGTKSRRCG